MINCIVSNIVLGGGGVCLLETREIYEKSKKLAKYVGVPRSFGRDCKDFVHKKIYQQILEVLGGCYTPLHSPASNFFN